MRSLFSPQFCFAIIGISLISGSVLQSAEDEGAKEVAAKAHAAAAKGLAWLKAHQQADGSLATKGHGQSVAVASLAGQAFLMSGGNEPAAEYREPYEKCLNYVREHVNAEGQVKEPEGSIAATMYNQAYVTTFLARAYRHDKQEKTLEKLKLAVGIILNAQNDEGAWRYQLKKADGDSSVTACAVVALGAAKDAGVEVPQEAFDKSLAYLRKLQNEDGGFSYTLAGMGSAYARSAAAATAVEAAGGKGTPSADKARCYLQKLLPSEKTAASGFFLHGHHYTVQLFCGKECAGTPTGREWHKALVAELARQQQPEGEWKDPFLGPEYSTATACIILQSPQSGKP